MRRLSLILMILLLTLGGWAADVMATGMAVGQLVGSQATRADTRSTAMKRIADGAHGSGATAHFHSKNGISADAVSAEAYLVAHAVHDCDNDIQVPLSDLKTSVSADAQSGHGMDCGSCPSCQACHTVGLSAGARESAGAFSTALRPEAPILYFASADSSLSQKPPIS